MKQIVITFADDKIQATADDGIGPDEHINAGICLITNTLKALYNLMPSINAAEKIGGDIAAEIGKQLDQHIEETRNA
ncbi:hypothetical protein ACUY3C_07805 [Corynebacterium marquesiae]